MGVSRCHLESVPFRLAFSPQLSTSTTGDLLQVVTHLTLNSLISSGDDPFDNLCVAPHSGPGDTAAHGRTVSVSTLSVCRAGDYVLAADCINACKENVF